MRPQRASRHSFAAASVANAVILAVGLWLSTGALGQTPSGADPESTSDPKGSTQTTQTTQDVESDERPNYGGAPNTALPYRHFRQPYFRFFMDPLEYRATGYDEVVEGDTIRIGFLAPLGKAPDSDLGVEMLEGTTLAIEEANREGGLNGTPFGLVIREDNGLWGASSNEMVAFKHEDDALAVIGSIDGATTHIALRVALKTGTLMINTGSTDPTLTETKIPWLLRSMADDRQQGYALAAHIFGELGLQKVAALRVNDRFGRVGIMEFRDAARRLKKPLMVELRWNREEREFDRQLDRIAQLEPEALVLWGNAEDTAAVVKEVRRRGLQFAIFGCDRLATNAFLNAAGAAAEGVTAAASYDPTRDDPALSTFTSAYLARFEHPPGTFAAHAYDGTRILLDAIQKAGRNRVRIRDEVYELREYEGVTGRIEFDPTLNDVGPVYLATVREGTLTYREADFSAADANQPQSRVVDSPSDSESRAPITPYRTLSQSPPVLRAGALAPVAPERGALRIGAFVPFDSRGQAALRGIRAALEADARCHPQSDAIELIVSDAGGPWGRNSTELVQMVFDTEVLAVIGSTERRGSHLAAMVAAKAHLPVVALCPEDPTITQALVPWVYNLAEASVAIEDCPDSLLGYDAMALIAQQLRQGNKDRRSLRNAIAELETYEGRSGTFRFDPLGNRVEAFVEREP